MLIEKLAGLADHLDSKGCYDEANEVDALMKFIVSAAKEACGCDCQPCMDANDGVSCGC